MPRRPLIAAALALVWIAPPTVRDSSILVAAEPAKIADSLGRRIIDKELPRQQTEKYAAGKVPPLPQATTPADWERHVARWREETFAKVIYRGEAAGWRDAETEVKWFDTLEPGEGYRIRKLRFEAIPGLWVPALLYEPAKLEGKVPVVLNVNGHDAKGTAAPYKQIRCINQAKRGMIALNVEWFGMGQLRGPGFDHYKINQLDLCGTSGLALHYLSMKRSLDLLLDHEHADPKRVAVTGLSGGGWQTIVISALDERVTLSNPVAGYSSYVTRTAHLSDLGDSEQTPVDLATVVDYTHLTAMRAPRPTLLTYNAKDNCCFASGHALPPLMDAARPVFDLYGKSDALRSHVNEDPGTHNFEKDNRQALYRMFGDFFYADAKDFDPAEIPCEDDVQSAEALAVPLPEDNLDFHKIALGLMKDLPRASDAKPQAAREALREIVRAREYSVRGERAFEEAAEGGVKATGWKLEVGGTWTLPATLLEPAVTNAAANEKPPLTILVADEGRAKSTGRVEKLLASGRRVLAVDPFYLGESQLTGRDWLLGLLISAIGDRPLGLQASQTAAVARWARQELDAGPVEIVAVGPRASLFALVAAALEPEAIGDLTLHDSLSSLKQIVEKDITVRTVPEYFCFGLLERFDVPQLEELVKPRAVRKE
ncbi:MAG: acetylxylan esterase [Planctomycetaceae bacterium]